MKDDTAVSMDESLGLAGLCTFLSTLYRSELTSKGVEALERSGLLAHAEAEGYGLGRARLQDPDHLANLARDFTRAFIGPGPHAAPYGSVHHPDDPKRGRLWGDSTIWVRRFILDHGLNFEGPGYDGIPDHISHELEFYAALVRASADAVEAGDEHKAARLMNSRRKFFEKQLERWLPLFVERARKRVRSPFYAEVLLLTEDFVKLERRRLRETA